MPVFIPLTQAELEPILRDAFPYIWWCPIHDARTPEQHRAIELASGLDAGELN